MSPLVRLLGLLVLASACAGPAPRIDSPPPALVTAADAGADHDALAPPAAPPAAPAADDGPTAATDLPDTAPAAANLAPPPPGGDIFRKPDGTCWWHRPITCPANTDCVLPPHRQVACPPRSGR